MYEKVSDHSVEQTLPTFHSKASIKQIYWINDSKYELFTEWMISNIKSTLNWMSDDFIKRVDFRICLSLLTDYTASDFQ